MSGIFRKPAGGWRRRATVRPQTLRGLALPSSLPDQLPVRHAPQKGSAGHFEYLRQKISIFAISGCRASKIICALRSARTNRWTGCSTRCKHFCKAARICRLHPCCQKNSCRGIPRHEFSYSFYHQPQTLCQHGRLLRCHNRAAQLGIGVRNHKPVQLTAGQVEPRERRVQGSWLPAGVFCPRLSRFRCIRETQHG